MLAGKPLPYGMLALGCRQNRLPPKGNIAGSPRDSSALEMTSS